MLNDKAALRSRLLAARAALSPEQRQEAARALAEHALPLLPTEPLPRADTPPVVAGYVSVGAEPGTRALLDALRARGARVLLPVLLPDNDLDWGRYRGPEHLVRAGRGLLEPDGDRLGPDAVRAAGLLLLPGLAVDRRGVRLGRGGGSYDRVLARLARGGGERRARLATLLYDPELLEDVPAEAHDLPVDAAVTPSGVRWF
ncbi:5-formyltetrahydrofolate cyclo-ligase [Streptacidiphilus sp. P02-A3a]|uniref:5-formyltetrahydrofolate cyclo-ligase n=1 Tax=Streptacidiphilus sp. P02-A3a TaxID=2704468 RepID=UPI0015FAF5E3|nr:5-formyltetrahydrofolate cyclo-ligase [Streptacidiphilus sp. P02-A3a]QMU72883.1 5-formyltetrahydrofolate cyclo-ligase [Streptacidiphilus sp. P02-A3a]